MVLQVCAQCGSEFSSARLDAVYCSPACRQRAYRSRNAKTVTAEPEPVPPNRNAEVVTDDRYEQYRAQCDADVAAYKAQLDAQNQKLNALRDDERRRYKEVIDLQRAKGIITPDEYRLIWSCLHPDSRLAVSPGKLATAFRLFTDPRMKTLIVKEPPPPRTSPLPPSTQDLVRKSKRRKP